MKKNLRPFAVLICAALALCFTQCKKSTEDLIVGKWSLIDWEITQTYGSETVTNHETPDYGESTIFSFNKGDTFTMETTYEDDGTTYTDTTNGTYTVADNKIIMTTTDGSETFDIVSLTNKELVLSMSESNTMEGITYTITVKITMKRQ